MRGFMLTAFFFIVFMLTAVAVSYVTGTLSVEDHPSFKAHIFSYNTALASVHGKETDCYIDINTFGNLNKLDLPEEKRC
jgi:hypothetical protein